MTPSCRVAWYCIASLLLLGCNARHSAPIVEAKPARTAKAELRDLLEQQGYVRVALEPMKSGYLGVDVRVSAEQLFLMLDTGAPQTAFDTRRTKRLDLKWRVLAKGRTDTFREGNSVCEVESIEIGSTRTGRLEILSADFSGLNPIMEWFGNRPVDGTLGADVLKAHSAIIDYASCSLYLRPSPVKQQAP